MTRQDVAWKPIVINKNKIPLFNNPKEKYLVTHTSKLQWSNSKCLTFNSDLPCPDYSL